MSIIRCQIILVLSLLVAFKASAQGIEIPSRFTIKVLDANFNTLREEEADSVLALQPGIFGFLKQDKWEIIIQKDTFLVEDLEAFPYNEWRLTTASANFYLDRFGKIVSELDRTIDLPKTISIPKALRGLGKAEKAGEKGLFIIKANNEWRLVDSLGHPLFSTSDTLRFEDGFIKQIDSIGIGAWSQQGCLIATPTRCGIAFQDGNFVVDNGVTLAIIDTNGQEFFGPSTYFSLVEQQTEGYFRVRKRNKFGFANKEGIIGIPCRYTATGRVNSGVVPVKINNKWAVVSVADNFLVQPLYDSILTACDSVLVAKKFGFWGLLRANGSAITSFNSEKIIPELEGYTVKGETGWGYLNKKGQVILNQVYESIAITSNTSILVKVNSGFGLYNMDGQLKVPANYQRIETNRMQGFYFLYY